MILTPSNAGSGIAGIGIGIFAWGAFLKSDKIPWVNKLMTVQRKESALTWMNDNKGMSLLGLETVNFSIHGITSANSVMLALGNSALNVFILWIYLPVRQMGRQKQHVRLILKKAAL